MSRHPPPELDGAKVLKTAEVSGLGTAHTGNTRHFVGGELVGPAPYLAIAQYPDVAGVYLFQCNENWEVVTDTWHETIEGAEAQAEFEYRGVSTIWIDQSREPS